MTNNSLTIQDAKIAAHEKGGKCRSKTYKNVNEKLKWQCELGHVWETSFHVIRYTNSWCPLCKPLSIEEAQDIAHSRGGKCLSKQYINAHEPLKWECSKGHQWEAAIGHLKYEGTWCKECSLDVVRLGIEALQAYAKKHKGKCLSTEYKNTDQTYTWQCERGHEFAAKGKILHTGSWCNECFREDHYNIIKNIVQKQNGKLLSKNYVNNFTKMALQCNVCGHKWESIPSNIKKGRWCAPCRRGDALKTTDLRNLAIDKKGEWLSPENKGISANYLWACAKGHTWKAKFPDAKKYWCQQCKPKI